MKAIDLGTLGGADSEATAVNDYSQVVGRSARLNEPYLHAFSWTKQGGMVDLTAGVTNALESHVIAVTNSGLVFGNYTYITDDGSFSYRGFVWSAASGLVEIGTLNGRDSLIQYVSKAGQAVGRSGSRGFSWTQSGGLVDLGLPGSNGITEPVDVSEAGHVVGAYEVTSYERYRAFLWTASGGLVDLGDHPSGTPGCGALAVNNLGQVTGTCGSSAGRRGFYWTPESGMLDLGTSAPATGRFINDAGQVAGSTSSTFPRAFYWSAATGPIYLGAAGGYSSEATGLSVNGVIVGVASGDGWQYAAVSQGGGPLQAISLGGNSFPNAVSDQGRIVGFSYDATSLLRGFVWTSDEGAIPLPTLGGASSDARAVSDSGQVVGVAQLPIGYSHATLWEPATPPIAPTSIPPQAATEGMSFGYSVPIFADADGDVLSYEFSGLPDWLQARYPAQNPRYLSGRPPFTESTPGNDRVYTITVTATDPWGLSASQTFTLTVQNVNRAPVASTVVNKIAYEAKSFSYSVPAYSDPDGDPLTYTFTGLPSWLTVPYPATNPRYISGTPPLTVSSPQGNVTYVVTMTATDPGGASVSRSFNVVVADNRYPVPGAISNQVATENVAFSYNMPAFTDPDGDAITYTFYGLPSWLTVTNPSVNPRYLSGRPPYTESTRTTNKGYTITVNARDAVGQTTQRTFTVTVVNVNRPPIPPTIADQTAYEGSAFSFNAPRFTDPDGDAMTYAFSGLPGWLRVTDPAVNDRYISGRPPYTEAAPGNPAVYPITMTATDAGGATASRTFNLTVNDVPQ